MVIKKIATYGFALSEALISLFLFGVVSLYALPTFVVIVDQQKVTKLRLAATQLAQSYIEELKQTPWNELQNNLQAAMLPPFQRFATVCDQTTQFSLQDKANPCDATSWGTTSLPESLACDAALYGNGQKEIKVLVTFRDNKGGCHFVNLAHLRNAP